MKLRNLTPHGRGVRGLIYPGFQFSSAEHSGEFSAFQLRSWSQR